jgi:hypothetical protein
MAHWLSRDGAFETAVTKFPKLYKVFQDNWETPDKLAIEIKRYNKRMLSDIVETLEEDGTIINSGVKFCLQVQIKKCNDRLCDVFMNRAQSI